MLINPVAHGIQHVVEAFSTLFRIPAVFLFLLRVLQGCLSFFGYFPLKEVHILGVMDIVCKLCLLHCQKGSIIKSFEFWELVSTLLVGAVKAVDVSITMQGCWYTLARGTAKLRLAVVVLASIADQKDCSS